MISIIKPISPNIAPIMSGDISAIILWLTVLLIAGLSAFFISGYVDLPASLFGYNGNLFILEAYGDSMNQAGIDEGDYIVVKEQQTANDGDLVVALTNNENNLKRIHFDDKKKVIVLCPESNNPIHKPKEYKDVRIQGVVLYIIKKAI